MVVQILKHSLEPKNIIFPYPVIPVVFGLTAGNLLSVWKPVAITFVFYPAINLWNHINDAEDDYRAGKFTPFIEKNVRFMSIILILFLYILSAFLSFIFGGFFCFIFFTIVLVMTFLYSDNMFSKLRLKKHYITEILVYVVSIPSYMLMLYSSVRELDLIGLKMTALFTPLLLSTVFIKDLKDISADKNAGLKTLGVEFDHKFLIKLFVFFEIIYFILIVLLFFGTIFIVSFIPVVGVLAGIYGLSNTKWRITTSTARYLMLVFYSGLASVVIFLITSAVSLLYF